MSTNIIGVSAHYHDSACCLLQDATLTAAAQEERFTRRKHDASLPKHAFRYCLREAGLTITDIDRVAYYEEPAKKLARQLWMLGPRLLENPGWFGRLDPTRPEREIREDLGYEGPLEFVSHHEAHAASAFLFSEFAEAAVYTVDGVGEWTTTTQGYGCGNRITTLDEVVFPDSLGLLYSAITGYLGFEVNEGEYKVMGLAPYGQPRYVDRMRSVISAECGRYCLDMKYFDFVRPDRMYSDELIALLGAPPREPESCIDSFHQDVARSLQVVLEDVLLDQIRHLYRKAPSEHLCMAGGVALNCVANGRILREGPFKKLFVQPASNDTGGALGAAAIASVRMRGDVARPLPMEHVFLGPAFCDAEILGLLTACGIRYLDFRGKEPELLRETCEALAAGKVVGWFQGRMELGPRSLGARSILADPRDPSMRERINTLVKMREAFRPFAPAVLESRAADHFHIDHPSPFMLETCRVDSPLELPAVTHVDRSARLQTVSAETNGRFARLLMEFERLTGCPILLNTSFNRRGEPIVCTPLDALLCFAISNLDILVIENFIVDGSGVQGVRARCQPGQWVPAQDVSHRVYTLF